MSGPRHVLGRIPVRLPVLRATARGPRPRPIGRAGQRPVPPPEVPLRILGVIARSAVADVQGLVPPPEPLAAALEPLPAASLDPAALPPVPVASRARIPALRRRLAAFLAASLVVVLAAGGFVGTRTVLAQFVATKAVTSNTFATGAWAVGTTWYLHNNPTPPVANTAAQFNLALDATKPTAGTLYNYDTNCDSRAGRSINRNTGLVSEAVVCQYATWRSAALAGARTLSGTATLAVWARKTSTGGTNPTLRAFLRVFNPATSAYTELGTANATVTANSTSAWVELNLTWSLAGVSVPAGRQVEIKLVATGGTRNVEIAYDANNLASTLTLP